MNKEQREVEIDLLQLAKTLWENAKYIVIVTVILGLIGLVGSELFMTPVYESSARMIVNARKDDSQNITNDQLNTSKNLINTCAIIIRGREVIGKVIFDLKLQETYGQIANCVSVHAVNNTQIMEVVVQHENPTVAQAVAAKILEIAPAIIVETVEAGSVKPVEQAHTSPNPVSPSVFKNGVLLALVGFVLSCAVVVIVFLTDNTYKTDIDIQNDLELPVLGVIPTLESCKTHSEYGRKAKGRK